MHSWENSRIEWNSTSWRNIVDRFSTDRSWLRPRGLIASWMKIRWETSRVGEDASKWNSWRVDLSLSSSHSLFLSLQPPLFTVTLCPSFLIYSRGLKSRRGIREGNGWNGAIRETQEDRILLIIFFQDILQKSILIQIRWYLKVLLRIYFQLYSVPRADNLPHLIDYLLYSVRLIAMKHVKSYLKVFSKYLVPIRMHTFDVKTISMEIPFDKDHHRSVWEWNSQSALRPSIGTVGQGNPSFLEVNGA